MTISASTQTRVVVLLTSISLALLLLLAGAVVARAADGPETPVVTVEAVQHPVVAGDTLWDIAELYTEPGDDIRDTIFDVLVVPVDF